MVACAARSFTCSATFDIRSIARHAYYELYKSSDLSKFDIPAIILFCGWSVFDLLQKLRRQNNIKSFFECKITTNNNRISNIFLFAYVGGPHINRFSSSNSVCLKKK